ncbi:MAG: hypothetical protein AAF714_00015 [Pseudomonadota bacterium]
MVWLLPIVTLIGAVVAVAREVFPEGRPRALAVILGLAVAFIAAGLTIWDRKQDKDAIQAAADQRGTLSSSLEQAREDLKTAEDERAGLRTDLDLARTERIAAQETLEELREDLRAARVERREAQESLAIARTESAELQRRLEQMRTEVLDVELLNRCERRFEPIAVIWTSMTALREGRSLSLPQVRLRSDLHFRWYDQFTEEDGWKENAAAFRATAAANPPSAYFRFMGEILPDDLSRLHSMRGDPPVIERLESIVS